MFIGTNGGEAYGTSIGLTVVDGGITWDRVSIIDGGTETPSVALAHFDGFHVLGIVGDTPGSKTLDEINKATWADVVVAQIQANPEMTIAEAGETMWEKGVTWLGGTVANTYSRPQPMVRCISRPIKRCRPPT